MPNLPTTVQIDLRDLSVLLTYYWTAVNSNLIGDLGSTCYEETSAAIANRSVCRIAPSELESLVYHMKQVIFERVKPVNVDKRQKSYYKMMGKLSNEIPQLFKTLPSGEIVFINFEDRKNDGL